MSDVTLQWYAVELSTPGGTAVIDVCSTLGADAAGRRAVMFACHMGWGDLDTIHVLSSTPTEEPSTP